MHHHHRVRNRRLLALLFFRQRRARCPGAAALAHHFPELLEIVGGGAPLDTLLHFIGQPIVSGCHTGEPCRAQWPPIPTRHLQRVQHVHEGDGFAEGHIGVPILPGIRQTNRLAVLHHVRQDHHLRMARFLERAGDMHFQIAEHAAERDLRGRIERLSGKAHHAVIGQAVQAESQLLLAEGLRQIQTFDPTP